MASDKNKKTIADYVGDMVALEDHIEEAIDHQLKLSKDHPEAHAAIQRFHTMIRAQRDELKAYQKQVGETAGNPIKAAGSTVLGAAAGLIDKVRTEGVSKALRDDYTAFNHAAIGYTMLYATATALGDPRTAAIARKGLANYAGAVQEINHIIGDVVVWELKKDNHQLADANAGPETRRMVDTAWRENQGMPFMGGQGTSMSETVTGA